MKTIGNYFLNKESDGVGVKENVIQGDRFRFTFLTERLIRLEYSSSGKFEDRISQRVIFRKFPKVKFTMTQTDTLLQVVTSYFTLNYDKNKPFWGSKLAPGVNLNVNLNGTDKIWYYRHPEARNFGSIGYSLDDFRGKLKLGKGLYSTDGFCVLDDSDSYVLDDGANFVRREKGNIDLYLFMYRKDLGLCLQDYYQLTGYPFLVPRYALGNWWNKNYDYSKEEMTKLFQNFHDEDIPISVFLMGDKWHLEGDPFSSSKINLIELKQLCNHYQKKLALTLCPSQIVKMGTDTYQNLLQVLKEIDGDYSFLPLDMGKMNLYATYGYRSFISLGVDSMYIDYNNSKDNNSLALFNHYLFAMYGILLNKRGVVLSRNSDLAVHRDSIIFTGRTHVDWETLSILPYYQMSASNNGISYVASAIGGYYGGVETFELYIRYIQLGVFSTFLILASDYSKYYKREPWRWNVAEAEIIRKYLKMRYQLIPYLYTESYIYSKSGSPIIQPLYYKYPKIYDEPLYRNQYFFGSEMLVCPITKRKNLVMDRVVQRMFIPEGVWYELESGKKYIGNKYYMSFYKDEDYPVFCREGAIVPLSMEDSTEIPVNMEILVFPGMDGNYLMYEDDGISWNYKNGSYALTEFLFHYTMNHYELVIQNKGNPGLIPQNRNYKIRFKNTKMGNISVLVGEKEIQSHSYNEKNDFIVLLDNIPTNCSVKVTCSSEGVLINSMERLINDDIRGILEDLEIETLLKEKIDAILFSELPIRKKRIAIRKLKRAGLESKFIKMFLNLLEYIKTV